MLANHPELSDLDTNKVRLYFEALWRFSPTLAEDPLSAGAYVRQAMTMDRVAGGPLPSSLQELSLIEKNVQQARKDSHGETFMTNVMSPWKTSFLATDTYKGKDK